MKIIISLITIVVVFVLYVRFLELTSVFFPAKEFLYDPKEFGLDVEDVYFETKDGVRLHGWFIPSGESRTTVLFFHGNAGNIADRVGKLATFKAIGVNTLIVDYRGYGKSAGKPSENGLYKDAAAAYEYLITREDIDKNKIVLFGASLGGIAAVDLAANYPVAGLIIESSFTSAKDMAKVIYPFIPSALVSLKMDSASKIKRISAPKLFFHSRTDETVPYRLGYKLYEAAPGPKEFVDIDGTHNEGHSVSQDRYVKSISSFLQRHGLK